MTPAADSMLPITVRVVDYADPREAAALVDLMDGYARDVAGGGKPLEAEVMRGLVQALRQRQPQAFSVMAWVYEEGSASAPPAGVAVGLVNCFEGFSTFACKPLVNVHDVGWWHPFGAATGLRSGCCRRSKPWLGSVVPASSRWRSCLAIGRRSRSMSAKVLLPTCWPPRWGRHSFFRSCGWTDRGWGHRSARKGPEAQARASAGESRCRCWRMNTSRSAAGSGVLKW